MKQSPCTDAVPRAHDPQGPPTIILAVRGFATDNPTEPSPDDPLLETSSTNVANGMEVGAGHQPDGWAEFYDGWTPFVGAMPLWLGQRLRCTAIGRRGAHGERSAGGRGERGGGDVRRDSDEQL